MTGCVPEISCTSAASLASSVSALARFSSRSIVSTAIHCVSSLGSMAFLYAIEPSELTQWMAVETIEREENRAKAATLLAKLAAEVQEISGTQPVIYIREGRRRDELLALIAEEPSISVLVLAAGSGPDGPGPLITSLLGKMAAGVRVPITIVPGRLDEAQLAALA